MLISELERQAQRPWSVAELEPLEAEERDSMLGEKLYTLVAIVPFAAA